VKADGGAPAYWERRRLNRSPNAQQLFFSLTHRRTQRENLERMKEIAPLYSTWKAVALPLDVLLDAPGE
jgi:hypothetical protein